MELINNCYCKYFCQILYFKLQLEHLGLCSTILLRNSSFHSSNGMYSSHSIFLTDLKLVSASLKIIKKIKRNMEIETKFLKNMKEQHGSQRERRDHLTSKCLKEGKESFPQYSPIFRTFFFHSD